MGRVPSSTGLVDLLRRVLKGGDCAVHAPSYQPHYLFIDSMSRVYFVWTPRFHVLTQPSDARE